MEWINSLNLELLSGVIVGAFIVILTLFVSRK